MPRTKQPRKQPRQTRSSSDECDLLIRDFERKAQLQIQRMDEEAKSSIRSFETYVDIVVSRLPPEILQMTLEEVFWPEDEKENHEVSSSMDTTRTKVKKSVKRGRPTSDDGYVTENASTVTRASRATKVTSSETRTTRRTRSASRNRPTLLEAPKTVKSKMKKEMDATSDNFKTPMPLSKPSNNDFGVVTPKVKPNTPMSVLRRPRQGEMVLSMQGSPLLVSGIVKEETANINVPLANGNVISLLPNHGLRVSHIPSLDPETMRQLEMLKCHLEKVIGH